MPSFLLLLNSCLCLTLIVFLLVPFSSGFSAGAPSLSGVCRSMTPHHGSSPQTTPCPYKITLDKNLVEGGDIIKVTLESKETPFKGFLAIARKVQSVNSINNSNSTNNSSEPIVFDPEKLSQGKFISESGSGTPADSSFSSPANYNSVDITDCFGRQSSSVTNKDAREKERVEFKWQAPNVNGNYVISVTFVQSRAVFWVEEPSEVIRVTRGVKEMRDIQEDASFFPSPRRIANVFRELFKHIQFYIDRLKGRNQ